MRNFVGLSIQVIKLLVSLLLPLLTADTRLYFLIVGEGAGKGRMVAQARVLGLDNIGFAPLQPYEKLPSLLASAACHLVVHQPSPRLQPSRFSFSLPY